MSAIDPQFTTWVVQFGFAGFALYLMSKKMDDLKESIDKLIEIMLQR